MSEVIVLPSDYRFKNLTGQTVGCWTVVSYLGKTGPGRRRNRWNCVCKCGRTGIVVTDVLTRKSPPAGCKNCVRERHGKSRSKELRGEYRAWASIKQRCYNPKLKQFKDWGGRGITVCDRWLNSFEDFLADMGPRPSPSHTIERKNNDGNYEPGNCEWATRKQQAANRRWPMVRKPTGGTPKQIYDRERGRRLNKNRAARKAAAQ